MPTIEHYKSDSYLRLLLQGESGAGKTTKALQFPGVWVIDCDLNLAGPLRYLRENKLPPPLGYDTVDIDDEGNVVPENMRWARIATLLSGIGQRVGPELKTIVFDSMSKLGDYNKAHVIRTNPTKTGGMEMPSWGFYYSNWIKLVGVVTTAKVNCVFTAHDKVDKDEVDGSTRIFLNVQGQFQSVAGSLFTDVWHAEVKNVGGLVPKYEWLVRTIQDYRHAGLKNSLGLPPLFEFNWKVIAEKLK